MENDTNINFEILDANYTNKEKRKWKELKLGQELDGLVRKRKQQSIFVI